MANDRLSAGNEFPLFNLKLSSLNQKVSDVETEIGLTQEFSSSSSRWKTNFRSYENKECPGKSSYNNICIICGDSFEDSILLKKHFETHRNEDPFECAYCANLFETIEEFSDHVVTHTPKLKLLADPETENQPLKKLEQPEAEELEERFCDTPDHVDSPKTPEEPKLGPLPWQTRDNKIRPYNCIKCNRSFTLASSLRLHDRRKHLLIKNFKCNICSSSFAQSSDFYKHKRTHTGEKPYSCEECEARFSQKRNLRNHKKMHSNSRQICKYCGLGFLDASKLAQHLTTHKGKVTYNCKVCSIPYNNKEDLDLHLRRIHDNYLDCPVCDRSFCTASELRRHTIKHTGEKPYTCNICGKSFTHRTSLKNHDVVHTGQKPYQCTYCGYAFGYSGNLKAHMRIHTGERPYECGICQKTFVRSANLNEHLKIHTGEKPVRCEFCDKAFTNSSGYAKHKKIHTGDRPHKCNMCTKTFVQLIHLSKHILTHTGEKPHQCKICRKSYKRKDSLNKHIQQLHEAKASGSNEEQDTDQAIEPT